MKQLLTVALALVAALATAPASAEEPAATATSCTDLPFITTFNDVTAIVIYLGMATLLLSGITG